MGDGVLDHFGYPQAHEDDAERAVRSALALIESVLKLRAGLDAPLQVRVGIATGLVVVGDLIGEGDAQERGVVGDTPNLAARLQGIAEPNMVVIADSTRRLLGNLFEPFSVLRSFEQAQVCISLQLALEDIVLSIPRLPGSICRTRGEPHCWQENCGFAAAAVGLIRRARKGRITRGQLADSPVVGMRRCGVPPAASARRRSASRRRRRAARACPSGSR
jgi:Adenylate and Guanylate cyclase catalytic domain